MTIEFVSGDLFVNSHGADYLAHGCNCIGAMGAGIAVGFKERYPDMYDMYKWRCENGMFRLGDVFPWFDPTDAPNVLNLATQERPGADATGQNIYDCFLKVLTMLDRLKVRKLAMPMIGCGLGGLDNKTVKALMEDFATAAEFDLVVYETFEPGK